MYNNFLQNILLQLLEDVDLATRQRLWMQQDGVPPRYARNVRNILNQTFLNRWIGRDDLVSWSRSSDLTSLDFFFGYRVLRPVYNS